MHLAQTELYALRGLVKRIADLSLYITSDIYPYLSISASIYLYLYLYLYLFRVAYLAQTELHALRGLVERAANLSFSI